MKWFVGAALLLLAAFLLQSSLLAYAMYVLLCLLLLSRVVARVWIGHLRATRACSHTTVEIGDRVTVTVTVRNTGPWPVPWVLLEDLLPREAMQVNQARLKVKGRRIHLAMLWGGSELVLEYTLECVRHGYYQIGPLVMESGDLFGLHRRYRVDAEPCFVLVYPRTVLLEGYDLASRRPIGDIRLLHRLFEDPTRIGGVRPYETGDPLNRIHWRATARTGALHSKIYDPSSLAGATFLLDYHVAGYPAAREPDRSDLAVTAVLSLANAVYELGQQVGLVTNGRDAADRIRQRPPLAARGLGTIDDFRSRQEATRNLEMHETSDRLAPLIVETRRGVEQFQRIRETLARVELTDGLPFAQLVLEATPRLPRDATIVAVLPGVSVEGSLALGTLKRHGFAVTAVLVNLEGDDLEKAYGRLVAEGIDVRHLRNEKELPALCHQAVRRATPYAMATALVE
jgi:uncharacterized repeat protein (TIGR01451 family)